MESEVVGTAKAVKIDLAEIGFPIGDPVQIEFGGEKYFPLIKAYKKDSYLITAVPIKNDTPVLPEKNMVIQSAFLLGGKIVGFESKVIDVYPEHRLLALSPPENITKNNLRRTKRVKTLLPVAIVTRGGKLHIPGTILDLSEKGTLIGTDTTEGMEKGKSVRISLELPNISSAILINAIVRKMVKTSEKFLIGLSFENVDKGVMRSITHFCEQFTDFHYESEPILCLGQNITIEHGGIFEACPTRGWAVGEKNRLYIEPPENSRLFDAMETNALVNIEFKNKGTSFSLNARFVSSMTEPRLWEFEANEKAKKEVERNDERYSCMLPTDIIDIEKNITVGKGMVIDLSIGGLKLMSKNLLPHTEDNFLDIKFQFPLLRELKVLRVKVMRTEKSGDDYIYAGQFHAFKNENYATIEKYFKFCKDWIDIQQEGNMFK